MAAGVDIRSYLIADTTGVYAKVGSRVYQNSVPADAALPFVWFRRRGVEFLDILGEVESTPWREYFDFECVAANIDSADELGDAVRTRLHGASGPLPSSTGNFYQWVDVNDQSDDYIPRNMQADETLHVVSLDIDVTNQ
jgi:hypothetical protein